MGKLSDSLKSIYASGNAYTVIQLLEKFIKEVEKFEQNAVIDPAYPRVIEHVVDADEVTLGKATISFGHKVATYMPVTIGYKHGVYYELYCTLLGDMVDNNKVDGLLLGESALDDYIDITLGSTIHEGYTIVVIYFEDIKQVSPINQI